MLKEKEKETLLGILGKSKLVREKSQKFQQETGREWVLAKAREAGEKNLQKFQQETGGEWVLAKTVKRAPEEKASYKEKFILTML